MSAPCPLCPDCSGEMFLRHNRFDGSRFWGCERYPRCRGTRIYLDEQGNGTEQVMVPVPLPVLRQARLLCHPDRHPPERAELATRTTAALNAALQTSNRLAS